MIPVIIPRQPEICLKPERGRAVRGIQALQNYHTTAAAACAIFFAPPKGDGGLLSGGQRGTMTPQAMGGPLSPAG